MFARKLHKLRSVDAGFSQDKVLVVRVSTGPAYRGVRSRALYEGLLTRFAAQGRRGARGGGAPAGEVGRSYWSAA
jgi:hypothetical protein